MKLPHLGLIYHKLKHQGSSHEVEFSNFPHHVARECVLGKKKIIKTFFESTEVFLSNALFGCKWKTNVHSFTSPHIHLSKQHNEKHE